MQGILIFVLVCLSSSYAQYRSRCGQEKEVGTTLKETEDGVDGRYTVEWCTKVVDEATEWRFRLYYIDFHNGTKECPKIQSDVHFISLSRFQIVHSVFDEKLVRPFPDCEITCLSKPLDLIFSGCFEAHSQLARPRAHRTWRPEATLIQVTNRFDSAQAFNKLRPFYTIDATGDELVVKWDLHYIPVTDYSMEITHYENKNETEVNSKWREVQDNCTHTTFSIECRLPAPRARRCVAAALRHDAPWRRGALFKDANIMRYCTPVTASEMVPAAMDPILWWAGGAVLLVLAGLAACWAAHSRVLASLRKRVLQRWTNRYSSYPAAHAHDDMSPILLLYARDCAPAMEAVAILKDMLEDGSAQVYDIYSPECQTQYAAAPAEWLRALLARPDCRVLLLHTPAAAALHSPEGEPLLGTRVQYRRPHYGDALLQLALRLARDAAPLQAQYTKYYIATISDLQSDMLPAVASYRRYVLPAHASLLLHDLRVRSDSDKRLTALAHTLDKLVAYVRANEDYLKDELMFL